jgi:hypothetical protein
MTSEDPSRSGRFRCHLNLFKQKYHRASLQPILHEHTQRNGSKGSGQTCPTNVDGEAEREEGKLGLRRDACMVPCPCSDPPGAAGIPLSKVSHLRSWVGHCPEPSVTDES